MLAEAATNGQSALKRSLDERLDIVSQRLGQNLTGTAMRTGENLNRLNERLAVIDTARRNLAGLSSRVVGLQEILANKQARGAFGQGRMEAIVADGLPTGWWFRSKRSTIAGAGSKRSTSAGAGAPAKPGPAKPGQVARLAIVTVTQAKSRLRGPRSAPLAPAPGVFRPGVFSQAGCLARIAWASVPSSR